MSSSNYIYIYIYMSLCLSVSVSFFAAVSLYVCVSLSVPLCQPLGLLVRSYFSCREVERCGAGNVKIMHKSSNMSEQTIVNTFYMLFN